MYLLDPRFAMVLWILVYPYVRPILSQHFSQDWVKKILCILHEVEGPEVLKTDETEFNEKIFGWQKEGKTPKMVRSICLNIRAALFLRITTLN